MRKLHILFIAVCAIFTCSCFDDTIKIHEAKKAALASEVFVDTIMFDLCFYDSPDTVISKLERTGYYQNGKLSYKFPDSRISNMTWEYDDLAMFFNDSLKQFILSTYDYNSEWRQVIKEIYSKKYGEPIESSKSMYWFSGNLMIFIHESKREYDGRYSKSIIYQNLQSPENDGNIRKQCIMDDKLNHYSKEYWNKYIQPQKDKELEMAGRDI